MRILLISLVYWPDKLGNGPLLTDLAQELARRGHEVTVVGGVPHYGLEQEMREYRRRDRRVERHEGVLIRRALHHTNPRETSLGKVRTYLGFSWRSLWVSLGAGACEVVVVPSPPITLGITGWLVGRRRRAPLVYICEDIFPDSYLALAELKRPLVARLMSALARFVYLRSRRIICVTDTMRQTIHRYGVAPERVVTIYNWADTDEITPQPRDNALAQELGLVGRFVVLYAGNVGLSQRLDLLVECAAQMPEALFVIAGSGGARASLGQMVAERQLENVRFLSSVEREKLPLLLASCDVNLVPMVAGRALGCFPSKIYTAMASQRAILAALDEGSDAQRLLEQTGAGLCVAPDDGAALLEALRKLQGDPQLVREMGKRGRQAIEEMRLRETSLAAYERVLEEAVAESRGRIPS
jgi:colanic acid biosynthesis glycosyl transferase WcaI